MATLGFTTRPLTANLQKTTDGVELGGGKSLAGIILMVTQLDRKSLA